MHYSYPPGVELPGGDVIVPDGLSAIIESLASDLGDNVRLNR